MSARDLDRYEAFDILVCSETGDPGCMDCVEGQCGGSDDPILLTLYRCIECGADDAWCYGEEEFPHYPSCSLYRAPEAS